MQIYLAKPGGQREGPFTLDQINKDLAERKYTDEDFWAWYEGLTDWVPLYGVPGVGKLPAVTVARPAQHTPQVTRHDFGSDKFSKKIKSIPLRAAVALSSRCARRVQPLTNELSAQDSKTIELVVQLAEWYARGVSVSHPKFHRIVTMALETAVRFDRNSTLGPASAAAATSGSAAVFADGADSNENRSTRAEYVEKVYDSALAAVTLTMQVYYNANEFSDERSQGNRAIRSINKDIDNMLSMNLGRFGEAGEKIDPSEDGPLGGVWE